MSTQIIDDGDIGKCDDCGSDAGPLTRRVRTMKLQGEPTRVAVYTCIGGCDRHKPSPGLAHGAYDRPLYRD